MQRSERSSRSTATHGPTWLERMRGVSVLGVAKHLGLDVQPSRGASGGAFTCPVCNAQRRHTKTSDKRAAAGVRNDGRGWRCFQCDVSGDALNLVAYALRGKSLAALHSGGVDEVREWCENWLGLDHSKFTPPPKAANRDRAESPRPPRYPPIDEVRGLWDACRPVTDVPDVAEWLLSKRLDPQAVTDTDLARALHPDIRLPRWARFRINDERFSDWSEGGYLLIAQLVDMRGVPRSVLARNVRAGQEPKSRAASAFERRCLVLACALGRQVLALGTKPAWWAEDVPLRFEIAEGEKKWIMRSTLREPEHAPACIGIESGSWTAELAARIPDGSGVFIATDPNDAGARYATTILRSLAQRIVDRSVQVELHPCFQLIVNKDGPVVKVRS